MQDGWCTTQVAGGCSPGGPELRGLGPSSLGPCQPPSGARQVAAAGLTLGFCYLCTMSLISFTELRSLLKS